MRKVVVLVTLTMLFVGVLGESSLLSEYRPPLPIVISTDMI